MNLRPIFYVMGLLLLILAMAMVLPLLIDLRSNNPDWKVFFLCILITSFFGGALTLSNFGQDFNLNIRQAFTMTVSSWVAVSAFAALPFNLSELQLGYTDAFFEAVSGLTTTGATVVTGLDNAPPGILLWRAILQWMGGLSLILMALSVMPFLNIGGMKIFRTEAAEGDRALPRMASLSLSLALIYAIFTLACALSYYLCGMTKFDAMVHAMTTLSTGGFTTHDASLGYYQNPAMECVAILFMILAGMPFVLYIKTIQGSRFALLRDQQVRLFLFIIVASSIALSANLYLAEGIPASQSLLDAVFNVVSLMTGTGYVSHNYNLWGGFATALLFFLMASGACAGSTTCGIKLFRFQVFFTIIRVQLKKLVYPRGVFRAVYNGKPIPDDVPLSVISFLFMYATTFMLVALALAMVGLDPMTALSGAIATLSNAGPGMGDIIGPLGNYGPLPEAAKWILSTSMILGRLEILAALVILHPLFWKN